MDRLWNFAKTTIAGGFFVILPVVLIWLVLEETMEILEQLIAPFAEGFPELRVGPIELNRLLAIGLLLAVCFATGLIVRTRAGSAIGRFFESNILARIPGYTLIKSLTSRFSASPATGSQFAPALVRTADGVHELAFIVDELHEGRVSVFCPLAPTPTLGTIRLVESERVERLDASMGAVVGSVMNWGIGSRELFENKRQS